MRLVTPIWFKRLFRKPKTGSDEVAIYVKTDNKVYKRLPNNGDEVELGGGIELVKLNNTYYGVGESVGGVLQPQDNIKTSTTNPVATWSWPTRTPRRRSCGRTRAPSWAPPGSRLSASGG